MDILDAGAIADALEQAAQNMPVHRVWIAQFLHQHQRLFGIGVIDLIFQIFPDCFGRAPDESNRRGLLPWPGLTLMSGMGKMLRVGVVAEDIK